MIDDIEGIIVSTHDYGEKSKIVNILTPKYGVIGAIAKGSRTMKSDLRSTTDKLSYGIFHLYYKEGKLSNINSVDVMDSFKNIKTDISRISYASYILDLASQVNKQNKSADVYFMLINTLKKIDEGYDPLVLTNILELKYLGYLGVAPIIDECATCGSKDNIHTLSVDRGGYVCINCYQGEPLVDNKTIKLIRMFKYLDISKIERLDVSNKIKYEINDFLDSYYDKYTGLYLKSKDFIKSLNKLDKE